MACHGILVTHDDGWVECLEAGCTSADGARHEWRLSCRDLDGRCPACTEAPPLARSHAA